ncbi:hypothetical protein ACFV3R_23340 [Streptomyces sp. NPDC059740]|uniref:hypothetical protein n=1 Tax=Streptomyces sp. NPDC059740 TaxID=3346926 RepID=UPI00364E6AB7
MKPVEYAVAVERYLDAASLGAASRRVYRIALETWAWLLVGRTPPQGAERRRAAVPVLLLDVLASPAAGELLDAAHARRTQSAGPRTVSREVSVLRSALGWWREQGWLGAGEVSWVPGGPGAPTPAHRLSPAQLRAVLRLPAPLREQTLWHLLYDSGATVSQVLALDVSALRPDRQGVRAHHERQLRWSAATARLLTLHLVGRSSGPVFLTDRRAPAGAPHADRCPVTGRGRLSYRRAAELFTTATAALDPAGHGWTLRQLRSRGTADGLA